MYVVKKDGTKQKFDFKKIEQAVDKAAKRICQDFDIEKKKQINSIVLNALKGKEIVPVYKMHGYVESALDLVNKDVAKSYKDFRNYKSEEADLLREVSEGVEEIMNDIDDRSNSNTDAKLIPNQRVAISKKAMKEWYKKYHLTRDEQQAIADGFFYVHDMDTRLLRTFNCCIYDVSALLDKGFKLAGQKYRVPRDIKTAVGIFSDIVFAAAGFQYGGWSVDSVDKKLGKYLKMTIEKKTKINIERGISEVKAKEFAVLDSRDEFKQMWQGFEMRLNTINSCRGDFIFCTVSVGDSNDEYDAMVAEEILKVRYEGHGDPGFKKTQIFPKIIFKFNKDKHETGKVYEYLFNESIKTSSKCQYPDYIDSDTITPMGCRSFLSEYRDPTTNKLIWEGRGNVGAVSLNLPMIYMDAKAREVDFKENLDKYLQMIREIHIKTYEHIGKAKASSNPLGFTQGGFYGGYLKPNEQIGPVIKKTFTASFGITALHELNKLATGYSLRENSDFANDTIDHINMRIEEFKKEDGYLYSLYATPAETLCQLQVKQFRAKYGAIEGVSDKDYFSNSFHMHVSEEIEPFEKQDLESEMFHKCSGGHIQYVRIKDPNNLKALSSIVKRGIYKGLYQGVNFASCSCYDCGHEGHDFNGKCPNCGSETYSEYCRITGYMGYTIREEGRTINDAKMAEIFDRVSM